MYQQNFNELVDNVNNTEIKLSKIIVSDSAYLKKMLNEVSKNSAQASTSLSSLPVSINGIDETIKFINQVSGYTQSLANKLEKGESLTDAEVQTLKDNTLIQYFCSAFFNQEYYSGVRYNDPAFNIKWPPCENLIMNERDKNYALWQ